MLAEPPNRRPRYGLGRNDQISTSYASGSRTESATTESRFRSSARPLVDPLSLALSLRPLADERVEQALEQMLAALPW